MSIAYLFGLIIVLYLIITSRKIFFGIILFGTSFYLGGNAILLMNIALPEATGKIGMIIMILINLLIIMVPTIPILLYTFTVGIFVNPILAIILWIAIYFQYIQIDTKVEELLQYYVTIAGVASIFVFDMRKEEETE